MHFGRVKNKQNKSWTVTKIVAGSSIVICHLPQWQNQTSDSLASRHVRSLLVATSLWGLPYGAARPSLTPIFLPHIHPTAGSASMGLPPPFKQMFRSVQECSEVFRSDWVNHSLFSLVGWCNPLSPPTSSPLFQAG